MDFSSFFHRFLHRFVFHRFWIASPHFLFISQVVGTYKRTDKRGALFFCAAQGMFLQIQEKGWRFVRNPRSAVHVHEAASGAGGLWGGVLAALITLWVTFTPCFLWIFTFAPYVEWITHQPRLGGALRGITAAVVGVILNLSLWFGLNVLFADVARVDLGPAPHRQSAR